MKRLFTVLVAAFLFSCTAMPVPALEIDKEERIVLTAEEKKQCLAQGGCIVVSVQWVQELMKAAEMQCKADWKRAT